MPYFTIYRPAAGSPELQGAWRAAFLTLEPGLGSRIRLAMPGLLLPTFVGIGSDAPAHGVATLWLVAAGLALGTIEAARRHGAWVVGLLAGPIAVTAITSSLRRYPFGVPRHMTFAVESVIKRSGMGRGACPANSGSNDPSSRPAGLGEWRGGRDSNPRLRLGLAANRLGLGSPSCRSVAKLLREVTQRAVRPKLVVVLAPILDHRARFVQGEKPLLADCRAVRHPRIGTPSNAKRSAPGIYLLYLA